MGLFDFFFRREKRNADVRCDDVLLRALVGGGDMDEQKALSVPAFAAAVDFVADTAARLPIKLCRNCREHRRTDEITDDARLPLLNGDCGDLLSAYEARRAQLWDMLLYGAGYMYIEREGGRAAALRYVKRQAVSVTVSPDPIFKDAEITVNGRRYYPWDFIIAARHTHDGVTGRGLLSQIPELLATTFNEMAYENTIAKTGGNKKGFLQSERKLSQPALDELKKAWREMYSNNGSNMMVLNDGVKYQQAASTSVEMQLNEHKLTNADMIAQSLGLCARVTSGCATTQEYMAAVRTAVLPVVETYRAALDRALLTEAEKRQGLFFVPDTTELLKGDMTSRFGAYATALQNNIMSIDEVRYRENLPPLGFNFMRLGLADVLYDPVSGRIITPNTGLTQDTQAAQAKRLPPEHETPEERARHWTKGAHGYFTGSYSDGAGGAGSAASAGGGSAGGKGLDKSAGSGIIKDRNIVDRGMANGLRKSPRIPLSEADKEYIRGEITAIEADPDVFAFRDGSGSGYNEKHDIIYVSSNVFPSQDNSLHPRDLMSVRAALAHEYYGHRAFRGTKVEQGAWNDEFRASYFAAKNAPNLSADDRRYLILDCKERAKEAGVTIRDNTFMKGILYGFNE